MLLCSALLNYYVTKFKATEDLEFKDSSPTVFFIEKEEIYFMNLPNNLFRALDFGNFFSCRVFFD